MDLPQVDPETPTEAEYLDAMLCRGLLSFDIFFPIYRHHDIFDLHACIEYLRNDRTVYL